MQTPSEPAMTVFMFIKATRKWLDLSPMERERDWGREFGPLLAAHPEVRMRYYDAEYYTARVSDVIVWEFEDATSYRALIQKLRDTDFWNGLFEIVEIIPAIEDDYIRQHAAA